jgi:hypothetical protein
MLDQIEQAGAGCSSCSPFACGGACAIDLWTVAVVTTSYHACQQKIYLDPLRWFTWEEGQAAFHFGKYKGAPLAEVAALEPQYMVRS